MRFFWLAATMILAPSAMAADKSIRLWNLAAKAVTSFYFKPTAARRSAPINALARFLIRWNHLIKKNSRQFKNLEHVLVGKAGPLFRDML
jgi:hypothetical protein